MFDDDTTAPPCPFWLSPEHVASDGWYPNTRLVYGENFNYELLGFQQKCNACARKEKGSKATGGESTSKFAPWHPDVLRLLPRDLLEAFPAIILPLSAVDRRLITRIEHVLETKEGFKTLANHLEEAHKVEFHWRETRFTFRMGRKRRGRQASWVAADNETLQTPPRFGGFSNKDGYNGKSPSAGVLQAAWQAVFEARRPWYRRSAQLVDGENLALDDSHKLVKAVRVNDSKVYHSLLTVMNEHNQVIAQAAKQSVSVGSQEEARPVLEGVKASLTFRVQQ